MTTLSKKLSKCILWIVAMVLVYIIIMYSLGLLSSYMNKARLESASFNREVWLKYADSQECVRGEMISDLEENHLSDDMSLEQVVSLLGEPDREFRDIHNKWIVHYEIGDCLFFGNSTGGSLSFEIDDKTKNVVTRTVFQK